MEWGCEECRFASAFEEEALEHCDTAKHSLALRPIRTPSMIVCCRVDDPDPACVVESGHSLARCCQCDYEVRIGPSSIAVMLEHGARPWCVQCVAALAPESVALYRRWSQ